MERTIPFERLKGRASSMPNGVAQGEPMKDICLIPVSTIAGTRHVPHIAEIAEELSVDDTVFFKRDKRNFFDEWAVAICDDGGRRLGYVSCEHNEIVSRLLDGGKRLFGKLVRKSKRDAWTKLDIQVILHD